MELHIFFHFFAMTSFFLTLAIIMYLLKNPEVRQTYAIKILSIAYLSGAIWIALTYTNLTWLNTANLDVASIIGMIGTLMGLLPFFLLALFFRSLVQSKLDTIQISIFVFLISFAVGIRYAAVAVAKAGDEVLYDELRALPNLFSILTLLFFIYSITIDFRKMTSKQMNVLQLKQIRIIYFSLVISQLLGVIILTAYGITANLNVMAFGFITSTASSYLIAYGYSIDPRIISLFNDRAYLVAVSDRTGKLKYYKNFHSSNDSQPHLFTGIVTAISAIMGDLYDIKMDPISVHFDNGFIEFDMNRDYMVIALVEKESLLIKQAVKRFSQLIENKYNNSLEEALIANVILDLDEEFEKCFYFLHKISPQEVPQGISALMKS
jgi:hypothetical protein